MKSKRQELPETTRTIVVLAACCLFAVTGESVAQKISENNEDLLRFLNGDSLHGKFLGMKGGTEIRWQHGNARDKMILDASKLRRLAFNGGRARMPLKSPSFILLQDGDRLPGRITGLDDEELTIETEFTGTATIPRKFIRQIAPNPHGGAVHYIGPFTADEWTVLAPEEGEKAKEKPAKKEEKADPDKAAKGGEEEAEAKEEGPWVFSGGAYYSNGQLPITVDAKVPDKARIRFTLAWRNRLNAAIAFHATLKQPDKPEAEDKEEKEEKEAEAGKKAKKPAAGVARNNSTSSGFALTYGRSYVLTIYSNYAQLYRCDFDEDGDPEMDRLSTSSANLRLEEAGEAEFELRCDRQSGGISLFADGRFISQWEDGQGYAGTGSHLGFACQSSGSRLRVSDVVVTSWNGMVDSARSMEVEDRDIVLLSNGTDRYSGKVLALENGKFRIQGTYAEMQIPLSEVQEIRFAKKTTAAKEEEEAEDSRETVRLLFQPFGRLTVMPLEATPDRMKARHAAIGDLELDLRYSGLLEFSFSDSVLDSWDDDF